MGRLRDQLQQAQEALGEPALEDMERSGYGTVSKSYIKLVDLVPKDINKRLTVM